MRNTAVPYRPLGIHISDEARQKIFDVVCYLYLALYAYTAVEKILAHAKFEDMLRQSVLIGGLSEPISWLVPIAELAICVLLVLPWTKRLGLWAATSTMALFTLYICYMLAFAETRSCKCGGFISDLSWEQHLLFNFAFILLGGYALFQQYRTKKYS